MTRQRSHSQLVKRTEKQETSASGFTGTVGRRRIGWLMAESRAWSRRRRRWLNSWLLRGCVAHHEPCIARLHPPATFTIIAAGGAAIMAATTDRRPAGAERRRMTVGSTGARPAEDRRASDRCDRKGKDGGRRKQRPHRQSRRNGGLRRAVASAGKAGGQYGQRQQRRLLPPLTFYLRNIINALTTHPPSSSSCYSLATSPGFTRTGHADL